MHRKIRDTQLAAYIALKDSRKKSTLAVLEKIKNRRDGITAFEIAFIMQKPVHSISGRITELVEMGLVFDSGERRINPSSKRKCIVWETHKFKSVQNAR